MSAESGPRVAYFPGTQRLTAEMMVEGHTGWLLGVEIVGNEGSA